MRTNILQAKKALLALFVLLMPLLASAQTKVEIDGIWYNLYSETQKAEVTYKGDNPYEGGWYSGFITIPATVTFEGVQYSVTRIGNCAFYRCGITSITIPESVTSIEDEVFSGCGILTAISIPESVTRIGNWAFYNSGLTTIKIPESSQLSRIGGQAFCDCSYLTSFTIPKNVTDIGSNAFCDCSCLTTISFSEESLLRGIGSYTFSHCSGLTSINIPEGVTSIGFFAFAGCSNLTDITIPKSLKSIDEVAFDYCDNLTSVHISDIAAWCEIDFHDPSVNPLYLANNLYLNGELVTELTIPDSVTSIEDYAFVKCNSLTAIVISKDSQLKSIGKYAFGVCNNLATITCKVTTPPTTYDSFRGVAGNIPIYVPAASIEAYQSAEFWSEFTNIIGVETFKCATPTINYQDGRFSLTCDTEGAKVITHATIEGEETFHGLEFEFTPTLTFTAYATMSGFEDSDIATLTLCWIPCSEKHENEDTDILTIPSKPVLISTQGGTITLSGLAADTEVAAYTTAGTQLATATATGGTITLDTGLEAGSIAIVKIGEHSVKIAVK